MEGTPMNDLDQERLRAVCAEVLGTEPDELTPDTDFEEDLNLDREDLADLFVAVEDAFSISLEDGIRAVHTMRDLETLVEDLVPA
jgi:acyl carrier protein